MGAFTQLRLLLWKNILTQWRSPVFTLLEFIIPLLLIGASFGLMIGLAKQFEKSFEITKYNKWGATGQSFDFIANAGSNSTDSMYQFEYLVSGNPPKCLFLQTVKHNATDYTINFDIAYSPNTTEKINQIMSIVQERYTKENMMQELRIFRGQEGPTNLSIRTTCKVLGFPDEKALVAYVSNSFVDQCNNSLIGGIVFDEKFVNSDSFELAYKIRLSNTKRRFAPFAQNFEPWSTKLLFSDWAFSGPVDKAFDLGGTPGYWDEGFLTLQRAVDISTAYHLSGRNSSPSIFEEANFLLLQRFPFPPYSTKVIEIGALFLPTIMVFSLMSSVIYIVRNVVMEKEDRLKYMRVMGLSQWIQWIAHFIINYTKILVVVVASSFLMHFVTKQSDGTITLVLFLLYAFCATYFAFALSTFLQTGTVGTLMAVICWILLYFWSSFFLGIDTERPYPLAVRMLNCVNPNVALGLGLQMIAVYETQADGLHWSNIHTPPSPDAELTMLHLLIMLAVDGLLFVLITWYVEAVNPAGEGISQPPWFPFLPSYWCPGRVKKSSDEEIEQVRSIETGNLRIEPDTGVNPKIQLINLTKEYGTGVLKQLLECNFSAKNQKLAVDRLSINMYEGQITTLLGHNGAGKSTTFSMLIGTTGPTSGTAYIDGFDIRNSLPAIRRKLGFCPQYNILVNRLTVWEHLEFFCKLKERPWNPDEARFLLHSLQLDAKINAYAGKLSGGQQRKLSLAIALIGGSEIVVVDEPTSGMDVGARHNTWALLQKEKTNRTILLTTHFMEEADLLGDKIAILAYGRLQCSGSSMFLKKQYGTGYHLQIVYQTNDSAVLDEANRRTHEFLRLFCPSTICQSIVGTEATFLLAEDERPKFSQMFGRLEAQQAELMIRSFGVSITTMEEVFLRVNDAADELMADEEKTDSTATTNSRHSLLRLQEMHTNTTKTSCRFLQHFYAMFVKRAIYYRRHWAQFIPQLIVPVVYMLLFVWAAGQFPSAKPQPPLRIDMSPYASQSLPANVYFDQPSGYPGWVDDLNETIYKWTSDLKVQLTTVEGGPAELLKTLVDEVENKGTRTFGLHNPVAFETQNVHDRPTITALFNNFCHHSPALGVAIADSLLMRPLLNRSFYITVTNHPMPPTIADSLKNGQASKTSGLVLSYAIITAMSMVVSGFASLLIRERKKRFKHVQMMSGLKPWMYWLTTYVWDFVFYLIPAFLILMTFVVFKLDVYVDRPTTTYILGLVMVFFAWAAIPFVYSFSFAFSSAPKGYTLIVIYNIISGMTSAITERFKTRGVPILRQVTDETTAYLWERILSVLFPTYNLNNCFFKVYNNEFGRIACKQVNCEIEIFKLRAPMCCGSKDEISYTMNLLSIEDKHGIGFGVICFAVEGFLFWLTTILIENGCWRRFCGLLSRRSTPKNPKDNKAFNWADDGHLPNTFVDSDVCAEQEAVAKMQSDEHPVVVKQLRKKYGNFEAVKGISFHSTTSDCFGLLGVNGAGKTSTFRSLVGETSISSGDAYINGYSVRKNWQQACATIGYCPQYDAVLEEMTGEETLFLIARLRGLNEKSIADVVDAIVDTIDIKIYAKRPIKTYSGGNKRRLSLGMALMGMPTVLMLDEPTTGVDPKARRVIWDILAQLRALGKSIILTSHSMDECEALCTNLAIMVNGQFSCFGSPQHIKNKFGSGYTLLLKVRSETDVEQTKKAILSQFPDSVLKETHLLQMNFELKRTNHQQWSSLFDRLEKLCGEYGIVDYSLSQTTLEQVFLEFSRQVDMSHALAGRPNEFVEINLNTRL